MRGTTYTVTLTLPTGYDFVNGAADSTVIASGGGTKMVTFPAGTSKIESEYYYVRTGSTEIYTVELTITG